MPLVCRNLNEQCWLSKYFTCYSYRGFTTEPGTDMLSPGLVSDGTRCGDGHVSIDEYNKHPKSLLTAKHGV